MRNACELYLLILQVILPYYTTCRSLLLNFLGPTHSAARARASSLRRRLAVIHAHLESALEHILRRLIMIRFVCLLIINY
jgi:hypothetical protein